MVTSGLTFGLPLRSSFPRVGTAKPVTVPIFFEIGMGRFLWGIEYCLLWARQATKRACCLHPSVPANRRQAASDQVWLGA